MIDKERLDRAVMALHDYGTRDGATHSSVIKSMKNDGFTIEDIRAAVEEMS